LAAKSETLGLSAAVCFCKRIGSTVFKNTMTDHEPIAVVLSGGGARGAYQAGVLKGIAEILDSPDIPFRIISGLSAGAINGVALAAEAQDFRHAADKLWTLWSEITTDQVYVTDLGVMIGRFLQWFESLATGGLFSVKPPSYVFDTTPLEKLLRDNVDFSAIGKNVKTGVLRAVSVSATNYQHDKPVTFFTGERSVKPWTNPSQCGVVDKLTPQHVLASSALPVFFRPQKIQNFDYGDGGIGLKSPLSPAIKMGAHKLCVIGIQNPTHEAPRNAREVYRRATVGDVAGTLLNSMLFGSINEDILHCLAVNAALTKYPAMKKEYRVLPLLSIMPSKDLGQLESNDFSNFPFTVRHLLKGFGISQKKSWDLISYLAFHPQYARELLKLGRADALSRRREIRAFFKKGAGTS
jgi:NTE family protein